MADGDTIVHKQRVHPQDAAQMAKTDAQRRTAAKNHGESLFPGATADESPKYRPDYAGFTKLDTAQQVY
jgi:hypothetical protein